LTAVALGGLPESSGTSRYACLPSLACQLALVQKNYTKRKAELGICARPHDSPCRHEHAYFSVLTHRPLWPNRLRRRVRECLVRA
jgi:hypothetical protein